MVVVVYTSALQKILRAEMNLLTSTLKVMLVSGYAPDKAADVYASTPAQWETTCTGYVPGYSGSGRKTLAGKSISTDDPQFTALFDANDVTWVTLSGATATGCVVYKHFGSDGDSELILYSDTGFPKTFLGGDFTIRWSGLGVFRLKQA